MKVTKEVIEKSRVVLNVEVDEAEMQKSMEKAYRHLASRVAIPGFRKGKAPRVMLERYLGKEAFTEEALQHLIPETFEQAVKEHDVDIIARPEVEVIQTDPVIYKATVPVRPTVEPGDYRQVKVTASEVTVTEDEVEESLNRLRELQAPWEPVERPVAVGDMVSMDILGVAEDKTLIDDKGKLYQLAVKPTFPVPGFDDNLVGASKGDTREFSLTLPERFKELSGKECKFTVAVHEVKQKKLPELNDDFAKSLGQELETVEALRERIRANIRSAKEAEERAKIEEQVIDAAVDVAQIVFPDVLTEHEIEHLIEDRQRLFGGKENLDRYLASLQKSPEELKNELRPVAEKTIKRSLIVEKIADVEHIEVDSQEIDAEVERLVNSSEDKKEDLRKVLESPAARDSLKKNLRTKKTVDRLVDIALGKDTTPAVQEKGEKDGRTQ